MTRKVFQRLICLMLAVFMIVALLAACGSNKQAQQATTDSTSQAASSTQDPQPAAKAPVTITYWEFQGTDNTVNEQDPVSKEIEKITGVKIEKTGGDYEKEKVILAGGDLPDLMLVDGTNFKAVLDGQLALPLDDLIKSNGQNLEKYAPKALALSRKFKNNGDGKLYLLPISTADPNAPVVPGYYSSPTNLYVRWDFYKELGYPDVNNTDDLIKVLSDIQKKHPTTPDGKKVYGVSGWQDWGLWNFGIQFGFPNGEQNIDNNHNQNSDNQIVDQYSTPDSSFWQSANFYYKANKAGILDPDFFINKYDGYVAKYKAGQLLTLAATWQPDEAYASLKAQSPLASFEALPNLFPYDKATQLYNYYGWGAQFGLIISKNSKVADRVMDLLNFTFSPEGSRLINSGIKGVNWDIVNGKPQEKQETMDLIKNDKDWVKKTGISSYLKLAGLNAAFIDSTDGGAMDLINNDPEQFTKKLNDGDKDYSQYFNVSYPGEIFAKLAKDGKLKKAVYTGEIPSAMATAPADIKKIDTSIEDYVKKNIAKAVLAKSDDEFNKVKAQILEQIKKLGGDQSVEWWNTNWEKAKADVMSVLQ